jgi:hypothetical protein
VSVGSQHLRANDSSLRIADLIPRGTAAAFILLEHLWAIGLKEAVGNANGTVIAQAGSRRPR